MQIVHFQYNKDGQPNKDYFVGVHNYASTYLEGYDLIECKYKRFLLQKIAATVTTLGNEPDEEVYTGKVVNKLEMLDRLGYDQNSVTLLKELSVSDNQLAGLYTRKTGLKTVPLIGGYFFLYHANGYQSKFTMNGKNYTLVVPNGPMYFLNESGKKLSPTEFVDQL